MRGMRLLNASGCLDALATPELAATLDAFVTKTVTPVPRAGNDPIRITDVDSGMLNSIGLQNLGIEVFVTESLPRLAALNIPIWVSVGGFSADDYARLCARLDAEPDVATIELNVSCPNVHAPAESAWEIVAAARGQTTKPLYAKLSPNVPDIAAVATAAVGAGADGLTLVNTVRGMALDPRSLTPTLATGSGGLSGPALRPIALSAVFACASTTDVPIVAVGGISQSAHVLEFVAAGASDVALGTVLFAEPYAAERLRAEVGAELEQRGFASFDNVRGLAHRIPSGIQADEVAVDGGEMDHRAVGSAISS